jgi:hypothetical protein
VVMEQYAQSAMQMERETRIEFATGSLEGQASPGWVSSGNIAVIWAMRCYGLG